MIQAPPSAILLVGLLIGNLQLLAQGGVGTCFQLDIVDCVFEPAQWSWRWLRGHLRLLKLWFDFLFCTSPSWPKQKMLLRQCHVQGEVQRYQRRGWVVLWKHIVPNGSSISTCLCLSYQWRHWQKIPTETGSHARKQVAWNLIFVSWFVLHERKTSVKIWYKIIRCSKEFFHFKCTRDRIILSVLLYLSNRSHTTHLYNASIYYIATQTTYNSYQ